MCLRCCWLCRRKVMLSIQISPSTLRIRFNIRLTFSNRITRGLSYKRRRKEPKMEKTLKLYFPQIGFKVKGYQGIWMIQVKKVTISILRGLLKLQGPTLLTSKILKSMSTNVFRASKSSTKTNNHQFTPITKSKSAGVPRFMPIKY